MVVIGLKEILKSIASVIFNDRENKHTNNEGSLNGLSEANKCK